MSTQSAAALERNRAFAAAAGHQDAAVFPNLRLFVVTCLDPRVDPAHFLDLEPSDAIADDAFRGHYVERIGVEESILREHAIVGPAATVTSDVDRLRSASTAPPRMKVSGHVYDVVTGLVETIVPAS